ncbi:MAG: hypothetical protein JNJ44_11465 [Zoogloeaceae bacterium]|nr:hypothetical protein [Zoogloeaceae bacterium]
MAILNVILRVFLCAGITGVAYWRLGGTTWVLTLPLWGLALARPLVDAGFQLPALIRRLATLGWEGRYTEFDGVRVRTFVVGQELRMAASDVDAILGWRATPTGRRAHRLRLGGHFGGPPATYPVWTLIALLEGDLSPTARRFRHWLEREVHRPHQLRQQRDAGRP